MITQSEPPAGGKFNVCIAAGMFVITPLIFYSGPGSFMLPKTTVFELAVWLLAASLILHRPVGVTPVRWPLIAFISIYAASSFFAQNPIICLKPVALFASGAALAWTLAPVAASHARPRRICALIAGMGALMASHGLLQFFGADIPVFRAVQFRVFSTAGTPAALAGYLAVSVCLLLPLIASEERPGRLIALFAALFAVSLCLALTSSRSGIAAVAAGAPLTALLIMFPSRRRPSRAAGRLFVCALLFAFSIAVMFFLYSSTVAVPFPDSRPGLMRMQPSVSSVKRDSVRLRLFTLKCALSMWEQRPFTGNGPGAFTYLYPLAQAREIAKMKSGANGSIVSHRLASHAHNEYAEIAVESGVIGLAAFSALIVFSLISMSSGIARTRRPSTRAMFCGVLGAFAALLAQACFEFTFRDPLTAMLFWSMIGVGCSPALIMYRSHIYRSRFSGLSLAALAFTGVVIIYVPAPYIAMSLANSSSGQTASSGRDSIRTLKLAASIDPASPEILLVNAKTLRRFGDLPGAIDKLTAALALSNSPEIYGELGRTLAMSGMFEDAGSNFTTALSIDPWMPSSAQNIAQLAGLMRRTGRTDESEALIEKAADIARPAPGQRAELLKYLDGMRGAPPAR